MSSVIVYDIRLYWTYNHTSHTQTLIHAFRTYESRLKQTIALGIHALDFIIYVNVQELPMQ